MTRKMQGLQPGDPAFVAKSDKKWREHERDRAQQFDQHVQAGTRGIFERISDGVADHRRFMRIGALTACLLYTSPSPRDGLLSRMPSSA